jgi:hypothetical protein
MHLKSSVGPIYVLLVNKDIDCTSPVAIEVPPPKAVLESSVKVLSVFTFIACRQFVVSFLCFLNRDVYYVVKQFLIAPASLHTEMKPVLNKWV